MKEKEYVDDMFGRTQVLINGLEALGHTFTKAHINLKTLDRFPKVWEPKTTTIREARNLKILAWDELLGLLSVNCWTMDDRDRVDDNVCCLVQYFYLLYWSSNLL